jgi:hypothetical protein
MITLNSNIRSVHSVHLAAALAFKADILVTSDTLFISEAKNLLKNMDLIRRLKLFCRKKYLMLLMDWGLN